MKFEDFQKENIVIFDGAMGTSIQNEKVKIKELDDFSSCLEYLNITFPKLIEDIHLKFLKSGANVIETNTFGANEIVLSEYDLQDKTYEINFKACKIAQKAVEKFGSLAFVSGSVGSTSKLPSLEQISVENMKKAYLPQIEAFLDAGIDLIQVETCQDMLQTKAVLWAIDEMFSLKKVKIPVIVQMTLLENGKTLMGSGIEEIVSSFVDIENVYAIGLNCGLGPKQLSPHIVALAKISQKPICVLPNAGLPIMKNEKLIYDLSPDEFAQRVADFVIKDKVEMVGGCCGTTYETIEKLSNNLKNIKKQNREGYLPCGATSVYKYQAYKLADKPLIIGEKANTNGSKIFAKLLLEEKWGKMQELAISQKEEGADVIDVCLANLNDREEQDMQKFVGMLNKNSILPLVIDSTSIKVIETALQNYAGKIIINSTNFERGDSLPKKFLQLCKKYGCSLICLAIDEKGMAKTFQEKIDICNRFIKLAKEQKVKTENLFFDCLTFSLASTKDYRNSAAESILAINKLSKLYPELNFVMGVSNVSYGLKKSTRKYLNSIFLDECVKNGLNSAIVDKAKIVALNSIEEEVKKLCYDIIYNNYKDDYDPLLLLIEKGLVIKEEIIEDLPTFAQLENAVIKGREKDLELILENNLKEKSALNIINEILLPAMQKVGEMFKDGSLQLPFVLKSAEIMKTSISFLKNYLSEETSTLSKKSILLATVEGDVHDIGKNLVGIILENNGYEVIDLGVKQTNFQILEGIKKYNPDALGMSALLIKSTYVMKENLKFFKENKINIPVICGGATLNEEFVNEVLQKEYDGKVYFAKDAFQAISFLKENKEIKISLKKENSIKTFSNSSKEEKIEIIPKKIEISQKGIWTKKYSFQDVLPYFNDKFLAFCWNIKKEEDFFIENKEKFLSIAENILEISALYGFFPAQKIDDKIEFFYEDKIVRFSCPRHNAFPFLSLGDFFPKEESSLIVQLVSIGEKSVDYGKKLKSDDHFQEYFLWHGFCSTFTEALANLLSEEIKALLKLNKPLRFSFGYSALPILTEQKEVIKLFSPFTKGINCLENGQLEPQYSTCGIIIDNEEARYW